MVISLPACILIDLQGWKMSTAKQGQRTAPVKLVHPGELKLLLKMLTGNSLLMLTLHAKGGRAQEMKQ